MQYDRIDFKKWTKIADILSNYNGIYAVESKVKENVIYGIADGYFAIITPYNMMRVQYKDVEELASRLKTEFKEEVLALYEDTKFLFKTSNGNWIKSVE